jgi:ATP-binding cassette subfamily F protein 3
MDSKDVLLDALEDFGGTLILVSHDRYFIDRLATKIIDVGGGRVRHYPGGYEDYRYSLAMQEADRAAATVPAAAARAQTPNPPPSPGREPRPTREPDSPGRQPQAARHEPQAANREERKRLEAEERRRRRAREALERRIAELEAAIADREAEMKQVEGAMAAPGFYANHDAARPVVDRHQALMWELGDLMHRWEELHQELAAAGSEG